jgi:hypothetical protein
MTDECNSLNFIFMCKEHSMAQHSVRFKMPKDELLTVSFSVSLNIFAVAAKRWLYFPLACSQSENTQT